MRAHFNAKNHEIHKIITQLEFEIRDHTRGCELTVAKNQVSIKDFEGILNEMRVIVSRAYDTSARNESNISLLTMNKLDVKEYAPVKDDLIK